MAGSSDCGCAFPETPTCRIVFARGRIVCQFELLTILIDFEHRVCRRATCYQSSGIALGRWSVQFHSKTIEEMENSQQTVVDVNLSERSYRIHISSGVSASVGQVVRERLPKSVHAVVIADAAVERISHAITESLSGAGLRVSNIVVPSGEASKSVEHLADIWQTMLKERTDRGSVVVAVGGGVTGDLAGFAAASFARGIPLVQVPTTLLSQVDSSVGGKTGINLPGAKNIVGAFWQPAAVLVDTEALDTLPRREFVSGLAEVAKYGVIMAPDIFEYLSVNSQRVLSKEADAIRHLVARSCECKAEVVAADERETSGRRAILNYGHTFAHAIEATAGYGTFLHGEAVSIGMHMAAHLSASLGRVSSDFVAEQEELLRLLELPTTFGQADVPAMIDCMARDKKVQHGKLRFVLPSKIGHVDLVSEVESSLVEQAITACA